MKLRALGPADWRALRELRLFALRTQPGLFFRHYDEEAESSDHYWTALAAGDDVHQLFGLFDGERLIGISGVFADAQDASGATARFGLSFILPEYRRSGYAAWFYEARLAWVRAQARFARIVVGHRRSNEASRRSIERFGFRWTGAEPHDWHDGVREDNVRYELRLAEPT